jgi:RHS repeat-associated protein
LFFENRKVDAKRKARLRKIFNSAFITSYERDIESDLDYAQARYYNFNHGRFTSPDPYLPSAVVGIPQSWNRYSYVLSQPFTCIDPDGEDWVKNTGEDKDKNPYIWIDKCAEGQKDCYKVVAVNVGGNLRVYGSKDEKDITNYNANKSGMIDMREVAKHHDAEFIVKPGAGEPYLNARTGSALFNVAYQYSQLYPDDQKLMMTAGSLANGSSLPIHSSHKQGNNVDLRYMGEDGKTIQSKVAYSLADVERTKSLIKLFKEQNAGLDAVITGQPPRFGLPDIADKALKNQHRDHMHFQRTYPKIVQERPGRQ